jgi:undecaprenyl-diphosphatase
MADTCIQGVDTGFTALGYAKVAALGVLQGITELLPISSTAHMRLVPAFLGWQDPGSAFSAAMQLAALAAVVSYFWRDVRALTVHSFVAMAHRRFQDRYFRFSMWIILATIPIGIAGLLAAKLFLTPVIRQFAASRLSVGRASQWRFCWPSPKSMPVIVEQSPKPISLMQLW